MLVQGGSALHLEMNPALCSRWQPPVALRKFWLFGWQAGVCGIRVRALLTAHHCPVWLSLTRTKAHRGREGHCVEPPGPLWAFQCYQL